MKLTQFHFFYILPFLRTASAELQDASQTYETKTVMLNKQLMDMALKLSTMEKKEKELAAQSQPLAACEDAESKALVASEQSQTPVGWLKERKELESRCETLQDQLTLALEDVASLKSRNEDLDMLQGQGTHVVHTVVYSYLN